MSQAHVMCQVNDIGSGAVRNKVEWFVNGMVVASNEMVIYNGQNFEIDVPENSTVRLDVAAIGPDGQMTWASSPEMNVGMNPNPPAPANPPPGSPSIGTPYVSYWS